MQDRLNRIRSRALKRQNIRPTSFQPGDQVRMWNHRSKRYDSAATIHSPVTGDDTIARSYKIIGEDGRMRHVTSSWLVPAQAEQ